jgi:hypothetical protein
VRREVAARAEPAEVHDPAHAARAGGLAEHPRRAALLLLEGLPLPHRVHEVAGEVHVAEGLAQHGRVAHVARDDLGAGCHARPQELGPARETAHHEVASALERGQEAAADVARGPRHQDAPPLGPGARGARAHPRAIRSR